MKSPVIRKSSTRKLLLLTGSLITSALVLEGLARVIAGSPAPWRVREGVYHHSLPVLFSGPSPVEIPSPQEPVSFLPEKKKPEELRVMVFGESSVQGAPWDLDVSAPAMLYDLLAERLPARTVKVVNMGRGAAMTLDSFYYLLAMRRFSPDIIVFYQGVNDRYDAGFEMCIPLEYPHLHSLWRAAVSHSNLLWSVRVYGASVFPSLTRIDGSLDPGSVETAGCDRYAAFRKWTDLLVRKAGDLGAQVIVTTPVQNDLAVLEMERSEESRNSSLAASVAGAGEVYRELLICIMDERCPLAKLLGEHLPEIVKNFTDGNSVYSEVLWTPEDVEKLGDIWRDSASQYGASVVEFEKILRRSAPGGKILPPLIVDHVHLSLEANWLLASAWTDAVTALIEGKLPDPSLQFANMAPDVSRYVEMLDGLAGSGYCDTLKAYAKRWLKAGRILFGASLACSAWKACRDKEMGSLIDWIRWKLGVLDNVSSEYINELEALDMDGILKNP